MQGANSDDVLEGVAVELHSDGCYRFDWGPSFSAAPVSIYGGLSPAAIDRAQPLLRDAQPGATLAARHVGQREYFALRTEDGRDLVLAQRNVPLTGSINFRDLGGYATSDGRRVQWGRLFRSGHMANLGADSVSHFLSLDIRAVCDFRTTDERVSEARGLPGDPRLDVLEITPGIGDRHYFNRLFASTEDPDKVVAAMHEMMRVLVLTAAPRYQRVFEVLMEGAPGAVLINCSAGKERTGVAAALVLSALGVPRATIRKDFLLSQRYFPYESEIPRVITKYEVKASGAVARKLIMPLLETRASYLQSAFAAIDERYGSSEGLLHTLYGLGPAELAHLRSHYTS